MITSPLAPHSINGVMMCLMHMLVEKGGAFLNVGEALRQLVDGATNYINASVPMSWDVLASTLKEIEDASSECRSKIMEGCTAELKEALSLKINPTVMRTLRHRLLVHILSSVAPMNTKIRDGPNVVDRPCAPPLMVNVLKTLTNAYPNETTASFTLPLAVLEDQLRMGFSVLAFLIADKIIEFTSFC
eukprot:7231220-Pyramimonas_sp.AAC.1